MTFNITQSQSDLASAIANLEPWKLGLHPTPDALEGRGAYLKALCKLVADHVEDCMADAASSQSAVEIDETEYTGAILDVGGDCAGVLQRAAFQEAFEP